MQGATKSQAYLSGNGNYTSFTSGKHVIRFRTPASLETIYLRQGMGSRLSGCHGEV